MRTTPLVLLAMVALLGLGASRLNADCTTEPLDPECNPDCQTNPLHPACPPPGVNCEEDPFNPACNEEVDCTEEPFHPDCGSGGTQECFEACDNLLVGCTNACLAGNPSSGRMCFTQCTGQWNNCRSGCG